MKTDNDLLKNFLIGFKMINDQLFNVLNQDGVKEIEALGKPFDPNLCHAIEKVEIKEKKTALLLKSFKKDIHTKNNYSDLPWSK